MIHFSHGFFSLHEKWTGGENVLVGYLKEALYVFSHDSHVFDIDSGTCIKIVEERSRLRATKTSCSQETIRYTWYSSWLEETYYCQVRHRRLKCSCYIFILRSTIRLQRLNCNTQNDWPLCHHDCQKGSRKQPFMTRNTIKRESLHEIYLAYHYL